MQHFLADRSPTLNLARGGFHVARGSLDQALCLAKICTILRRHHRITQVLAFLDIKSAYDTISPVTGVLQGSIPSPFPCSTYIKDLPKLLRPQPLEEDLSPIQLAPFMTCLLYADNVVSIADQHQMVNLLKLCEDHSHNLGYRWYPIPFRPGGYLDTFKLLNINTNKVLATMNQLLAIGLHPKSFSPLLAVRFYKQIIRAQLEYGHAITNKFEDVQNTCIRRIFGGSSRSFTKVMLHLTKLPSMQERFSIL
ncbi:hypothetical protein G6F62_000889 [Rhizopus arrhizus]|nr:hypothetical protein G6F23_000394 [Rhizopus arrhizus]KAG0770347.1 hypothetical protein G6F24_000293 [Rhizopus arrhizus]KAG0797798.1 hypothetical protein G6F21_000240 [Rhizopus arrhizus]KAG0802077.1 hypothetical protein G6F22_000619 [Rhizopus arrhizus]KAG0819664.1 hypothetical protein G6F20_000568 [Rhizopus arrhizus]